MSTPGRSVPGATPLLSAARGRGAADAPLAEFAYPFAAVLANGACAPAKRVALGIARRRGRAPDQRRLGDRGRRAGVADRPLITR